MVSKATIPDVTSADFDNELEVDLLECVETMDEEVESDGTNVADAPLYSRVVSMRLQILITGVSASTHFRWALYKKPDGEALLSNLVSQFHSSDDSPTQREINKHIMAKGIAHANANSLAVRFPIFIKKSNLMRNGGMKEGDKLTFVIAKDAAGTTGELTIMGNIYVKANA